MDITLVKQIIEDRVAAALRAQRLEVVTDNSYNPAKPVTYVRFKSEYPTGYLLPISSRVYETVQDVSVPELLGRILSALDELGIAGALPALL